MSTFTDFITKGKIGLLTRGMSRSDCKEILGMPESWIGKVPSFAPLIKNPEESPAWFYYNGSAGIYFNSNNSSNSVYVLADKMDKYPELFSEWPIPSNANMGHFRKALVDNGIAFEEGDPGTDHYWIITEGNTVASCFAYKSGNMLHSCDRPITKIENCASLKDAKNAVGAP